MHANEMFQELNKPEVCEGLDEWLRTKLFNAMKNGHGMVVNMACSSVPWSQAAFIRAMTNLGYEVEAKCDDRPCAQPYYKIAIRMTVPGR